MIGLKVQLLYRRSGHRISLEAYGDVRVVEAGPQADCRGACLTYTPGRAWVEWAKVTAPMIGM